MRLHDNTAIITGGVRGIGLGIARRFEAEGAKVILWDIDCTAFDRKKSGVDPVLVDTVDVSDEGAVSEGMQRALDVLGKVDILVNNAGVSGPVTEVQRYDFGEWQRVLSINLNSVFLCCRAVVPHMRERGYGRIVNIASIAGKEGVPGIAAYAASKAGVIGFTKSLARELVETGVIANCLAPVMVETELLQQMTPEHIELSKAKIPMKRLLQVPELAAMAAFAASPECSFTTGFTFDVSGGRATY